MTNGLIIIIIIAIGLNDTIYFKPYDKTYNIASPTQDEHPNVVVKCNPETGEMTSNW